MKWLRHSPGVLSCFVLLTTLNSVRADAPTDPLRLIPDQADLVVKIERPQHLIETILSLDQFKQLQDFEPVRELYESTDFRRFQQLLSYLEKQLGVKWPQMLEGLAGGGASLGVKFGSNPPGVLLVVQGTDHDLVRKFFQLTLDTIEQELTRQEAKGQLVKDTYRSVETVRIGKEFHAAVAGRALLISNLDKGLQAGIDRHLDGGKQSLAQVAGVAEARKLLPPDPLAWVWLNLETVHKAPQAKEIFARQRNKAILTVLFGGLLDVVGRSPYVCAGLYREKNGFLATIRMPRGLDGMPGELAVHVPPADHPGPLPLLEPKGVLVSNSFYLDGAKFWDNRAELFNSKQVKAFEEFDKNSGKVLLGNRLSQLLAKAGSHYRFVAVNQPGQAYQITPNQPLPAFALVTQMRDRSFGKSMEAILRGVALVTGTQVKLHLVKEKHREVNIIGYRFSETEKVKNDQNNVRFNFSPCFAVVEDQFLACSRLELGRELVDLLQKESKETLKKESPAAIRLQFYAAGAAQALQAAQDQLIAQTILKQALPPEEARKQVERFIDWVKNLGILHAESQYGKQDFQYDFRLILGK